MDTPVKTGIPGLDDLLSGGFEPKSSILVTGDSGSGKSTFCLQHLYQGIQMGEPAVYITFEESKEFIYKHIKAFGMDFAPLEASGKFAFLSYAPHEIQHFLTEGQLIADTIEKIGAKRLVIDSMTSFALLFDSEYKRKLAILDLLNNLKKWNCTSLMTAEGVMHHGELHTRFRLGYLTDGVIFLYNLRLGNRRQRAFEIYKMRGVDHSPEICPMAIKKEGIVLYPGQPVFQDSPTF